MAVAARAARGRDACAADFPARFADACRAKLPLMQFLTGAVGLPF